MGDERTARWPLIVALVLCVLGIGVSIYLSYIHYFVHTDPAYHSVCAIDAEVNCETVAQSPYSVLLGLPVSVWGLAAYALLTALCIWGLVPGRLHPGWPRGLLFFTSLLGLAASAALAYISFFRIESLCLFCLSLYVINLLLSGAAVAALITAHRNPVALLAADLAALVRRPLALVAVVLPLAAAIGLPLWLVLLAPPGLARPARAAHGYHRPGSPLDRRDRPAGGGGRVQRLPVSLLPRRPSQHARDRGQVRRHGAPGPPPHAPGHLLQ
jgi:uncharacterized membrane protein